jgi:hypothetical protein
MSKAKKYGVQGAIAGGLLKAAFNAAKQLENMSLNPDQKFNWKELFMQTGEGALIGGIGGCIIGGIIDYQNNKIKPVNTDAFLYAAVAKLKMNKHDSTYLKLQEKADNIMILLKTEYSNKLATEPFRIGSIEKGTAIRGKHDIDIALSFKKNSFRSTAHMFDAVGDFLENKIGQYSIVSVRNQHVSIGVFVTIDDKEYKFDVVPKKRSCTGSKNKSGYLFVNDSNIWGDNSSYTKTDFQALNNVRITEVQKKIVVILKVWKHKNNLPLTSHLLESLVLHAYKVNVNRIPRSITDKVIMVLRHIADNLDIAVIRSIENTNNILTNISEESKTTIINACVRAIEDYEYQPNSILEMFECDLAEI